MEIEIKCHDCGKMLKVTVEDETTVKVKITRKVEDETTWQKIAEKVRDGEAHEFFSLGDEISCELKDGRRVIFEVAAFSPYPTGSNTIALVMKDCIEDAREMNSKLTYEGGWKYCQMRKYLNEEFYELLPDDLKAVIKKRKIAQYLDGSKDEYEPVVSEDKLWLLSAREAFGIDRDIEADDVHFPLYVDEKSRVKQFNKETVFWWLRSPTPSNTYLVRCVYTDGSLDYGYASYARGVAAACLIG